MSFDSQVVEADVVPTCHELQTSFDQPDDKVQRSVEPKPRSHQMVGGPVVGRRRRRDRPGTGGA